MSTTVRYDIIDGPTASTIWDHAKYAEDLEVTIPVKFTFKLSSRLVGSLTKNISTVIEPRIIGVSHESGGGQSLNIEGYLGTDTFKGHYNARRREGFIEVNKT